MRHFKFASLVLIASALGAGPGHAAAPLVSDFGGAWNVTFFLENTRSTGATQCIVFTLAPGTISGVPTSGTWTSPSFPGWRGQWIQLGDHVRFVGVTGSLATSESGNVITRNHMGGVSFNHFSATTAANSSAGSFRAARAACASSTGSARSGGDPSQ